MRATVTAAALAILVSVVALPGESQVSQPSNPAMRGGQSSSTDEYRATIVSLRDTISSLHARLSHLRRQLTGAGSVTLLRWVADANQRCREVLAKVEASESTFRKAGRDRVSAAARTFADTLSRTGAVLREHCVAAITPRGPGEWADSVRAWVPYHFGMLERQLANYHREAARFAQVAGFKLEPRVPAPGE